MNKRNIYPGIHYVKAVHHQKLFMNKKNFLPVTDKVVNSVLSLPIYPELNSNDQHMIINKIKEI